MTELYQDTETYCETPIRNGLHRYAEDVEIMVFAYAVDNDPVTVLDLTAGDKIPKEILRMQDAPDVVKVMQNSQFDRTVLRHAMDIIIPVEQIHDTMIQALAHGLPGGLDKLCDILRIPFDEAKDKAGKQLINLFCKPRPKNMKLRRATRHSHAVEWQQFLDYAGMDITSMRAIKKKMPMWNYQGFEHELWQLDQRINDRGFKVDTELAQAAIRAIEIAQKKLAKRTSDLTHDDVQKATQRDRMLKHICDYYGVVLPDLKKSTLERRVNDTDLPWAVRELLAIRLEASMTGTSKYQKLIDAVSSDGRLRGTLQFDGASRTRRWAGRVFQPQNLMRPTHKQAEIDIGIKALKMDGVDLIESNVMGIVGSCIRGVIIPSENKKLIVSDLSNIEGRLGAWLADEYWKLQAFADYDAGEGADLYRVAYAKAFGIDVSQVDGGKDKGPNRQIGKVMELMLQYEGGVGAFLTGSLTYNIDLDELAEIAWPEIPESIKQEAMGFYDWTVQHRRSTFGLTKKVFCTCDALKRLWRLAHPQISSLWKDLANAARSAILNPGKEYPCRHVTFIRKGAWLRMLLPSGACLCYPAPRVEGNEITYMGMNQYSKRWQRIKTYGGKFLENACQSVARDVMADRMPNIEAEGYNILLTVHDELITEAPDQEEWNEKELSRLLSTAPSWAPGLPLAAGGFEAQRYRKD